MLGIACWAAIVWCSLGKIIAVSFVCPNAQCPKQPLCTCQCEAGGNSEAGYGVGIWHFFSLLASSPVWASKTGLARTRERAAKPRGAEERSPSLARSREARFACPNRRACSQANIFSKICHQIPYVQANHSSQIPLNFLTRATHLTVVKYPKARPKKSVTKISQNVTLQSLFVKVAASPKIHFPVKICCSSNNYY